MEIRKLVGWNVRKLRLKRGLSQEALAGEAIDPVTKNPLNTAHISRIENGDENPTVVVLDKLAKVLGVHAIEFFRPVRPGAAPLPTLKAGRKPKAKPRRRKPV